MHHFNQVKPGIGPLGQTPAHFARGWTVDIYALQQGTEQMIYRGCSLTTLVSASALFKRLADTACTRRLHDGEQTKIKFVLPRAVASAAFLRILEWIHAINEISVHGDIEDPQITTFDGDGLTQYLRLLQAANTLELKPPLHNQKRLEDMIKATIKKAFDTKNNAFRHVSITDREIGLIWDFRKGDRDNPIVKLLLALFVDAYDVRMEFPEDYNDGVIRRFDALIAKNENFRSAIIDVKTKKRTRIREEERERKRLPKSNYGHQSAHHKGQLPSHDRRGLARTGGVEAALLFDASWWQDRELDESQVVALMSRPEEFPVSYGNKYVIEHKD